MPRRGKILSRGRRRSARRGAARRGWLLLTRGRRARDRQVWFIDHFGNELTTLAPHSKQVNGLSIDDTGCFVARRVVASSRCRVIARRRLPAAPRPAGGRRHAVAAGAPGVLKQTKTTRNCALAFVARRHT